jgi:hypothetical protein
MNWGISGRKPMWPDFNYHPDMLSEILIKTQSTSVMKIGGSTVG